MQSFVRRHAVLLYFALALVAAYGFARYDVYMMDGDGTAFLDIAQGLTNGHAALAINGYWNPGYPALLALARVLTHPALAQEVAMFRVVNVFIFGFAMAACVFFTRGLARLRVVRPVKILR
jgi:hypothetical protein